MTSFYLLRPGIKILVDEKLVVIDSSIQDLPAHNMPLLRKLLYRPLWQAEAEQLSVQLKEILLREMNLDHVGVGYQVCSFEESFAWQIIAHGPIQLHWKDEAYSWPAGQYFLAQHFPDLIVGEYEIIAMRGHTADFERDTWIVERLTELGQTSLLEIGCGDLRLARLLKETFPKLTYQGIDLVASSEDIHQADMLQHLPVMNGTHTVIAEEVLEHIPESKLLPLMRRMVINGACVMLITTPNSDFNVFLNKLSRHPDHQFEWGRKELLRWIDAAKQQLGCDVEIHEIGQKHSEVAPTWGLVIRF